jgi:hypothetical protein
VSRLACTLEVGGTSTSVTTTSGGWIISNDQTAGAVVLKSNTKLLKLNTATTPQATLTVNPSPATRGATATITINPPTGAVGFKVTEWKCQLSFRNPGATAVTSADIIRPATESASTFDQNWQGEVCAPGTAKVKFVVGASLRSSGSTAVSATVTALDPVEVTAPVPVTDRTGTTWESTLVENTVTDLVKPIARFSDTGQHKWDSSPTTPTITTIAAGPNRGCQYVTAASCTFTSTPKVNSLISNTSSTFANAQDKAYLVAPAPVRVIPRNLYTVGAGGTITEVTPGAIATHFGLTGGGSVSAHCISPAALLTSTRAHEFEAAVFSHKANCLKARRALDPVKFIEAMVKAPGATVNFNTLFSNRVTLVVNAAATHDIIDEAQTQTDHALRFIAGQEIHDVNEDATGNLIGPVWNPTTNRELTN